MRHFWLACPEPNTYEDSLCQETAGKQARRAVPIPLEDFPGGACGGGAPCALVRVCQSPWSHRPGRGLGGMVKYSE